nr:immunoglobulin heavy chain junction region [Macaca mulatta]
CARSDTYKEDDHGYYYIPFYDYW